MELRARESPSPTETGQRSSPSRGRGVARGLSSRRPVTVGEPRTGRRTTLPGVTEGPEGPREGIGAVELPAQVSRPSRRAPRLVQGRGVGGGGRRGSEPETARATPGAPNRLDLSRTSFGPRFPFGSVQPHPPRLASASQPSPPVTRLLPLPARVPSATDPRPRGTVGRGRPVPSAGEEPAGRKVRAMWAPFHKGSGEGGSRAEERRSRGRRRPPRVIRSVKAVKRFCFSGSGLPPPPPSSRLSLPSPLHSTLPPFTGPVGVGT